MAPQQALRPRVAQLLASPRPCLHGPLPSRRGPSPCPEPVRALPPVRPPVGGCATRGAATSVAARGPSGRPRSHLRVVDPRAPSPSRTVTAWSTSSCRRRPGRSSRACGRGGDTPLPPQSVRPWEEVPASTPPAQGVYLSRPSGAPGWTSRTVWLRLEPFPVAVGDRGVGLGDDREGSTGCRVGGP